MGLTPLEDSLKAQLKDRKNAHMMVVDGMSKLKTNKVAECQSSVFHVSGLKWKLIVYPAGSDGTKDYLSFYLRIKDKESLGSNWEVKCSLKLSIVPQNEFNRCHSLEWTRACYNAKEAIIGEDCFISYQELNKRYLVNDKVVFCAEITNVQPNFPVTSTIPRTIGTAERLTLTEVSKKDSRVTWKITQFSSFDGEEHYSNEFKVGPRRWKMNMVPKGRGTGKGDWLSLFLYAADVTNGPKAKTLAVFKLRLLDQLKRNHHETTGNGWFHYDPNVHPESSGWGWDQFMRLSELHKASRGFLVNDETYLGVELLLVSTTEYI